MNFITSNIYKTLSKSSLKGLFLLGLVFSSNMVDAATYYLTSAGASDADNVASWNTAADGSGTALSSLTTASTIHTYIIPIGIDGEWNTSRLIGNSGSGAQSFTFILNGSLTITNNDVITFDGSSNVITWTTNGTLTVDEEGGDETFKTSNVDYAYFIFANVFRAF